MLAAHCYSTVLQQTDPKTEFEEKRRGRAGRTEKLLPSSTGQLSQLIPTGSLLLSATLLQSEAVVLSVFGILEIKYQDLHLLQQTVSRQPNHFPWALLSF